MAGSGERTEAATPRRIQKAREEGRFPNTRQFLAGVQFLLFWTLLAGGLEAWLRSFGQLTAALLRHSTSRGELRVIDFVTLSQEILWRSLQPLILGGAILVAGVMLVQFLVTRFGLATKNLSPQFTRLNPAPRLGGLLRENSLSTFQAVLMLTVFLYAVYALTRENLELYAQLPFMDLGSGVRESARILKTLFWRATTVFVVLGAASFAWELHRYKQNLKMSRQDIRDESKEVEGNPETRARIRRMQRDFHRRGMLKNVPDATVVIMNPTHYAVCLRYDVGSVGAPTVTAKAKNYLALRIRRIAEEHGVPVVENPPLAQGLYKSAAIGQEIPPQFYRAIAELLAYVFKVMQARKRP